MDMRIPPLEIKIMLESKPSEIQNLGILKLAVTAEDQDKDSSSTGTSSLTDAATAGSVDSPAPRVRRVTKGNRGRMGV